MSPGVTARGHAQSHTPDFGTLQLGLDRDVITPNQAQFQKKTSIRTLQRNLSVVRVKRREEEGGKKWFVNRGDKGGRG